MTVPDACDWQEATANIEMTFDICADHGQTRPTSAAVHFEGVDVDALVSSTFSALEQTLSKVLGDYPDLAAITQKDYPDVGVLPERAQEHLAKLLAHQYLLMKVAARDYPAHVVSGMLTMPF